MAYGDLTTFDSLRQWLDVTTAIPNNDIPMLEGLITSTSDWIHRWLNRFLPLADYEEIQNGQGGFTMVTANFPIISVLSLFIDDVEIPRAPSVRTIGYRFNDTAIVLRGSRFTRDLQNVVVQYRAGFARIPPAASQACNELVTKQYRERARVGVKQETIVGVDSYTYNVQDLLPDTRSALLTLCNHTPVSASSHRLAPTQTDTALISAAL